MMTMMHKSHLCSTAIVVVLFLKTNLGINCYLCFNMPKVVNILLDFTNIFVNLLVCFLVYNLEVV